MPKSRLSPVRGWRLGDRRGLGREILRDIPADEVLASSSGLLRAYLERRASPEESFQGFAKRYAPKPCAISFSKNPAGRLDAAGGIPSRQRSVHGIAARVAERVRRWSSRHGTRRNDTRGAPPAADRGRGGFPWHDPTLCVEERIKLASGRPSSATDGGNGPARLRPVRGTCARPYAESIAVAPKGLGVRFRRRITAKKQRNCLRAAPALPRLGLPRLRRAPIVERGYGVLHPFPHA